jgi:hypothetical protein
MPVARRREAPPVGYDEVVSITTATRTQLRRNHQLLATRRRTRRSSRASAPPSPTRRDQVPVAHRPPVLSCSPWEPPVGPGQARGDVRDPVQPPPHSCAAPHAQRGRGHRGGRAGRRRARRTRPPAPRALPPHQGGGGRSAVVTGVAPRVAVLGPSRRPPCPASAIERTSATGLLRPPLPRRRCVTAWRGPRWRDAWAAAAYDRQSVPRAPGIRWTPAAVAIRKRAARCETGARPGTAACRAPTRRSRRYRMERAALALCPSPWRRPKVRHPDWFWSSARPAARRRSPRHASDLPSGMLAHAPRQPAVTAGTPNDRKEYAEPPQVSFASDKPEGDVRQAPRKASLPALRSGIVSRPPSVRNCVNVCFANLHVYTALRGRRDGAVATSGGAR